MGSYLQNLKKYYRLLEGKYSIVSRSFLWMINAEENLSKNKARSQVLKSDARTLSMVVRGLEFTSEYEINEPPKNEYF